jgi:tetratricopeptide (TPR) repeat protein
MSDSADRGPRDSDRRPGNGRPTGARGDASRPYKAGPPAAGKPPFREGRPAREGEKRLWTKGGAPARNDRDARERETPEDRDPFGTRSVRSRHDDPLIPEGVEASELDRIARNELKTLSKENADGVALHLVMAARLIDADPALAHQHAISAARRAGRIGVVRETLAITAYATGDYALALRELRTYRRITGRNDQLPMMVDSERGLGRPEKALEEGRSVPRSSLPVDVRVELAIAMSGARLDLGQNDQALAELEIPELDPKTAFSYSPALFDAYATVLEELGRTADAEEWYERSERASDALDQAENPGDVDVIEVLEVDGELDDGEVIAEDDADAAQPNPDDATRTDG